MPPFPTAQQPEEDDLSLTDKRVIKKAEDILNCMANAVSAMKIFPSDHATVRNFVDNLYGKFSKFFHDHQWLEVGVEEYSFSFAGQVAYTDEMTIKSLPFFFFKDGTQILYFYRGLDRRELLEFLELIKAVSQKPGGDNDIVAALWESEFAKIQYYSPDEFLENQILAEKREVQSDQDLPELPPDLAHETLEVKVDLAKFSQGRIELKPEDTDKFHWRPDVEEGAPPESPIEKAREPGPSPSPDESGGLSPSPLATANIRAAGHDNIDLKKAAELGIRVANVPDYSPYAIAEHTVALILSLNRRIILSDKQVHLHNFTISDLIGFDLHNKTIGVIRVGKIGGVLIKILHGFGCHLLAHDILENEKLKLQYGFEYVSLQRLCSESNIISIHTCLTPQTKYLINKKFIDLMQRGVRLINTCRGGCVNTADVIAGLESGQIGYYGADVYENERGLFFNDLSGKNLEDPLLKKLLDMPNVLITPHQAFATNEALANIAATTFYNIDCWKKASVQGESSSFRLQQGR